MKVQINKVTQIFKSFPWVLKMSVKLSGLFNPMSLSSGLSLFGLTIGVCTLLVSMALVNSYERSFKESIYSVFSHVTIFPYLEKKNITLQTLEEDLKKIYKKKIGLSEGTKKEGLLAHKGKVSGVILEGVNTETIETVLNFKKKIIKGQFKLDGSKVTQNPSVLLGKGLVERFELSIGDIFSVVIPHKSYSSELGFSRKIYSFRVGGVLDLGSYEANKRFVIIDKFHVNSLSLKPKDHFSELKIKLEDPEEVDFFKSAIAKAYPKKYWVRTWKDKSGGLLEAIKIERIVIFFLVLILVIVAAFNVSTNLFLNLSRRLKEFSILQTIGVQKKEIALILLLNGFLLGILGLFFGFVLAELCISVLNFLLSSGFFVPPDVYKLTSISIYLSFKEVLTVGWASLVLCIVAAMVPAFSVYRQSIVKGLSYE